MRGQLYQSEEKWHGRSRKSDKGTVSIISSALELPYLLEREESKGSGEVRGVRSLKREGKRKSSLVAFAIRWESVINWCEMNV